MASNASDPVPQAPPLHQPLNVSPEPGGYGDHPERCGPIAVNRHVKDDGRALILYSRVERERA